MKREQTAVCERCGSIEHVHDGLCRGCRRMMLEEPEPISRGYVEGERPERHRDPELEPLHSPPWRHKGGG